MNYYKLINGQRIAGVATDDDFRRYQKKRGVMLFCNADSAQCIEHNGIYYRDNWFKNISDGEFEYVAAKIVRIDADEYNTLYELESSVEEIPIEEPEEINEEPQEEQPDITLGYAKELKIQLMSAECEKAIKCGFDVILSDKNSYHFSLKLEDQITIQALRFEAENGGELLAWHSDNSESIFYSTDDIVAIYNEMIKFRTYHTAYFNSLKTYINSLKSIDKVNKVNYGMKIPKKNQSEVLKYLNQ